MDDSLIMHECINLAFGTQCSCCHFRYSYAVQLCNKILKPLVKFQYVHSTYSAHKNLLFALNQLIIKMQSQKHPEVLSCLPNNTEIISIFPIAAKTIGWLYIVRKNVWILQQLIVNVIYVFISFELELHVCTLLVFWFLALSKYLELAHKHTNIMNFVISVSKLLTV
jgi:hypothetical protein